MYHIRNTKGVICGAGNACIHRHHCATRTRVTLSTRTLSRVTDDTCLKVLMMLLYYMYEVVLRIMLFSDKYSGVHCSGTSVVLHILLNTHTGGGAAVCVELRFSFVDLESLSETEPHRTITQHTRATTFSQQNTSTENIEETSQT